MKTETKNHLALVLKPDYKSKMAPDVLEKLFVKLNDIIQRETFTHISIAQSKDIDGILWV